MSIASDGEPTTAGEHAAAGPLLTVDQAALQLGIPAKLIRQWHRSGRARPSGILRSRYLEPLYRLEDLQPHVAAHRRQIAREGILVHEDDDIVPGEQKTSAEEAMADVAAALGVDQLAPPPPPR